MIVVVGSSHDPVANELVGHWPGAGLCSARDMTTAGWAWSPTGAVESQWVVGGKIVRDRDVSGVFVRRATFYEEEFGDTHPDDRRYLASEAHAFMADVLSATKALVANPVADGTFGDEVVRPDRWMRAAGEVGLAVAPFRLTSAPSSARRTLQLRRVDVVADHMFETLTFGSASARALDGVRAMTRLLALHWATFVFDGRNRLLSVTTARTPGDDARAALGDMLAGATTSASGSSA
jgi:hypothetical protein